VESDGSLVLGKAHPVSWVLFWGKGDSDEPHRYSSCSDVRLS
jgi:hypothetical protein